MSSEIVPQRPSMNKTYAVTGILSLSTVVLLVALLTLTIQWSRVRTEAQERIEGREQQLCVHCGSLAEPDPEKNDTDICCGIPSLMLTRLIKKFTREKYAERNRRAMYSSFQNGSCKLESDPAIRNQTSVIMVSGLNRTAQKSEDGYLIHFRDVPNSGTDHFKYEKGALHVKKTYFYYIFSQIKINCTSIETYIIFRLWINHFTKDGINRTILESSQSNCPSVRDVNSTIPESSQSNCPPEPGVITLMLGAAYKLNEGDIVSAMTSHPKNLSLSDHDYTFGMYRIGS